MNKYGETKLGELTYDLKANIDVTTGKTKKFFDSFMKILVFVVVLHGLVCISLSYILAFMGYSEVVESLSSTMVSEVIAPVTIYGITKTIENVSKYNDWVDRIGNKDEE